MSADQCDRSPNSDSSGSFSFCQMTDSDYAKVIFCEVEDSYPVGEDIDCVYQITESVTPRPCDYIGLFRVGWQNASECLVSHNCMDAYSAPCADGVCDCVVFRGDDLPMDSTEFYQFLYLTVGDAVCGASTPFRFHVAKETEAALGPEPDIESCHSGDLVVNSLQKEKDMLQATILNMEVEINNLKIKNQGMSHAYVTLQEELRESLLTKKQGSMTCSTPTLDDLSALPLEVASLSDDNLELRRKLNDIAFERDRLKELYCELKTQNLRQCNDSNDEDLCPPNETIEQGSSALYPCKFVMSGSLKDCAPKNPSNVSVKLMIHDPSKDYCAFKQPSNVSLKLSNPDPSKDCTSKQPNKVITLNIPVASKDCSLKPMEKMITVKDPVGESDTAHRLKKVQKCLVKEHSEDHIVKLLSLMRSDSDTETTVLDLSRSKLASCKASASRDATTSEDTVLNDAPPKVSVINDTKCTVKKFHDSLVKEHRDDCILKLISPICPNDGRRTTYWDLPNCEVTPCRFCSSRDATAPEDSDLNDASPKNSVVNDDDCPKDSAVNDTPPKDSAVNDAPPKDFAVNDASTKLSAPIDVSPKDSAVNDAPNNDSAPIYASRGNSASFDSIPVADAYNYGYISEMNCLSEFLTKDSVSQGNLVVSVLTKMCQRMNREVMLSHKRNSDLESLAAMLAGRFKDQRKDWCKKEQLLESKIEDLTSRLNEAADLYKKQYLEIKTLKKQLKKHDGDTKKSRGCTSAPISTEAFHSKLDNQLSYEGSVNSSVESRPTASTSSSDCDTGERVSRRDNDQKISATFRHLYGMLPSCSNGRASYSTEYPNETRAEPTSTHCSQMGGEILMHRQNEMSYVMPNPGPDVIYTGPVVPAEFLYDPALYSMPHGGDESHSLGYTYDLPCPVCEELVPVLPENTNLMSDHLLETHNQQLCPVCGRMFDQSLPPNYFKFHVENHFLEENDQK